MKKIIFLLVLPLLFSCDRTAGDESPETVETQNFSDTLQTDYNRRIELLPEAKQAVNQWLAYATAQNEIQRIRTSTARDIMENSQPLVQIMELLHISLPDTLRSPAVEARTNVLFTKARVLHQISNRKQKTSEEIFEVATDLIVEFDNFKLQLNELFLKTPDQFEFELDEEFEEPSREDPPQAREIERQ